MANTVYVRGMFGNGKTYFAGSPVVIDISGLAWPSNPASPFNVVRVKVIYNDTVVGEFPSDTGGQSSISFDISSALRAIWSGYDYSDELSKAAEALAATGGNSGKSYLRPMRSYSLRIYTEYMSTDGVFTTTECQDENGNKLIPGGRCMIGSLTEFERSNTGSKENADASYWEGSNMRNGDASTKPKNTPEVVGSESITSWTDVGAAGTTSVFYPVGATAGADAAGEHAPLVLRDSMPYADFLFANRRGGLETCSGRTLESMGISIKTKTYSMVGGPAFKPTRSLMAIAEGGRRSWAMSSGYIRREWAEWWTLEFLSARKWWMLMEYYDRGERRKKFVPVTVEPAKENVSIYDKSRQQMPHVDFTVTMELEG